MRTLVGRVPDRLLSLAAALGAAALLLTALGLALGVRPVYLRSGSMSPTLPTGSLVLVRSVAAADLAVGDVVCVRTQGGSRVTHRITHLAHDGGDVVLTLRGDANPTDDAQSYRVRTAYRVVGHVARAGFLLGAASSPAGLFVLGCFVMAMLSLIFRGGGSGKGSGGSTSGRRRAVRAAAVSTTAAFVVLGPGGLSGAYAAPWTDPATISGATLTADVIAAPATFTCGGLGVLSVTFNWSAVSGASSYTLHYGSGGSSTTTVAGTTATIVSAISGGTAWVVTNRNVGSTTWTSVASTSRTYTVAVVSLCS
ncbi:MAG: signal peptidase I [Marmoricola sp.]